MIVIDRRLDRVEVYVDSKNNHYYLKADCGKPIHWYVSHYENGQTHITKLPRGKWEAELMQAKARDQAKKEARKNKKQAEKKTVFTDISMTAATKKIVKTVREKGYQMTKSEWGYNYLPKI